MRLDGPWRRDPPAWSRRFWEAAILGAGGDHRVHDSGHFGGHGRVAFPTPVRVLGIGSDVVLKLPAKAVLLHANSDGCVPSVVEKSARNLRLGCVVCG
jgi:hypothetical protein